MPLLPEAERTETEIAGRAVAGPHTTLKDERSRDRPSSLTTMARPATGRGDEEE